jgi:DNA repair protein RadD
VTTLRPYQADQNARVAAAYAAGARRVVSQMPTGAGKTRTVIETIREELQHGRRVVFAAHRDSLVGDTAARLGMDAGVIAAGHRPNLAAPVQVCSLGTLHARGLTPPADLVVLDECHISLADTVRGWLQRYPTTRILGLTATPQRGDGQALGEEWDALVQGPSVRWLTDAGYLVPSHMVVPRGQGRGDAYAEMMRLGCEGRRTLVFSESIDEAKALSYRLRTAGVRVAEVYGATSHKRREQVREQLREGSLDVLVGCGVFVEGWDEPSVDTVVLDAAFGTVSRYLQAIGRGLRPSPGKTRCDVLDIRGAVWLHGLPDEDRTWHLTGDAVTSARAPGLALSRCETCWAVFERAASCPRCGAARVVHLPPRPPTRAEKLEAYETIPVATRWHAYYRGMLRVATQRRRMSGARAETWALAETTRRLGQRP